jgi:hypothetical protein
LEQIDESAFAWSALKSIVIPSSVKIIGRQSFQGLRKLISVIFEDGSQLEKIERFAFSGSAIETIVIPSSVSILCCYAFSFCSALKSFTFDEPSQLQRIEAAVFFGTPLTSVSIPSSVTDLDQFAFVGLENPEQFRPVLEHYGFRRSGQTETRRVVVHCHGLPKQIVQVIRAEFRRHCQNVSLDTLDSIVARLADTLHSS